MILNSGITILEAIGILRDQASKRRMKEILEDVYSELQKGRMLSEAIVPYDDLFPEFMKNMIRVGEASGTLDTILNQLADYYEHDFKIRRKVKSAMTYPAILAVLTVAVVTLLMVAVLPMFSNTLTGMGGTLPGITVFLMAVSRFMADNILLLAAVVIIAVILFSYYIRTDNGRLWFDGLKLRLPIVKNTVLKTVTARFARSMSILLKSGIPIVNAMEILKELIGNRAVEKKFAEATDEIKEGKGIAGSMRRLGIFPPLLIHMIVVGENTGELDEMLGRTAGFFDEEVEEAIEKTVSLIEPAMIIIMAAVIGVIILSVMLPMVSIMEHVQ
ncbi:MAG TPA: type II secretion system F family protein [Clostridiales bacterium]|nr:type II secretion system F family protein [Clostridiales bacterium]